MYAVFYVRIYNVMYITYSYISISVAYIYHLCMMPSMFKAEKQILFLFVPHLLCPLGAIGV